MKKYKKKIEITVYKQIYVASPTLYEIGYLSLDLDDPLQFKRHLPWIYMKKSQSRVEVESLPYTTWKASAARPADEIMLTSWCPATTHKLLTHIPRPVPTSITTGWEGMNMKPHTLDKLSNTRHSEKRNVGLAEPSKACTCGGRGVRSASSLCRN